MLMFCRELCDDILADEPVLISKQRPPPQSLGFRDDTTGATIYPVRPTGVMVSPEYVAMGVSRPDIINGLTLQATFPII